MTTSLPSACVLCAVQSASSVAHLSSQAIFSALDAFNIGANDVANSFATSVSSKSLTMRQAVLAAAICEFTGAVLVGARVADTSASSRVRASKILLTSTPCSQERYYCEHGLRVKGCRADSARISSRSQCSARTRASNSSCVATVSFHT